MNAKQSAAQPANDLQAIVFRLGDETYGIEIGFVHEIIRYQRPTPLPGSQATILGLINLRSRVLSVLSLRSILGLGSEPLGPSARIVIVGVTGDRVGLLVDEVHEVRTLPADAIQPPPLFASAAGGRHAVGIAQTDRGLVVLLDLEDAISAVGLERAG